MRLRTLLPLLPAALSIDALGAPALHESRSQFNPGTLFSPVARSTAGEVRHIALLIGIAKYQNFAENGPPGRSRLSGPVDHDIPRMQKTLEKWGFTSGPDMKVLADGAASKAGIEAGFDWLISRVRDTSDVVVIYYSGHGSSAPDVDGDEARLSPNDKQDEALVPWDVGGGVNDIQDPKQLVLDDQIGAWLRRIGTSNVTMIVDACYSGTITRGPGAFKSRGPVLQRGAGSGASATTVELFNPKHTLITAASAHQTAAEAELPTANGAQYFGVLTYYLTQALDAADSATHYDMVMKQVAAGVRSVGFQIPPQDPQLEGDRTAQIFQVNRRVPRQPVVKLMSAGNHWALDIGAVHGLRKGAVFDVFGPSETEFRTSPAPFGQVEVDSVEQRRAFASRPKVTGAPQVAGSVPIPNSARAVLALAPRGVRALERIAVYVAPSAQAVRADLSSLPFVTLSDSASATAVVSQVNGLFHVHSRGERLPPVLSDTITGGIRGTGANTGYAGTSVVLCRPLLRALSIAALNELVNPAEQYYPEVQLRFVRGTRIPSSRTPVFVDTVYVDSLYNLFAYVDAPDNSTLYLTAAIEGYVSDPEVIFPSRKQQGQNEPFPIRRWTPLAMGVKVTPPIGPEKIKVVVETRQFDLYSLMDSFPQCESARSGGAKGDRGKWGGSDPEPVTEWKGTEHSVLVLSAPKPQ